MNLTLSVDDQLVQRAREVAASLGTSLDQLFNAYLKQLAASGDVEKDLEELDRLSGEGQGRSRGWKFNREELYESA
jgi:antitoxin component of RelBE/YafQ-DinJ toxin-antitoxin module